MTNNSELLRDVPFLSLLDDEECSTLAKSFIPEEFKAGDHVFYIGEPGDSLYVVGAGKIELYFKDPVGTRVSLETVERGGIFGELSMLDGAARSASAVALEDSTVLSLSNEVFRQFISSHPLAALDIMATMAKRIRNTDEMVKARAGQNPNEIIEEEMSWVQKLANFIAQFSGSMSFLFLNAGFFFTWIVINLDLVPWIKAFDPYPFGLLTMAVSLEAIFLSIFVLLSQNLQAIKDHIRSDVEYNVNLKAELEISQLHEKVDHLQARLLERLHRIEGYSKKLAEGSNRPPNGSQS